MKIAICHFSLPDLGAHLTSARSSPMTARKKRTMTTSRMIFEAALSGRNRLTKNGLRVLVTNLTQSLFFETNLSKR